MPLSDFLIAGSIILGLVSIPILVTGPFSDTIPTGRLVLNMSDVDVDEVPSKMSKIFSSQNFVKTYETAFGRFSVNISAGEINEELSKPGKVTIVNQDTQRTIWKINTLQYQLKITKKPDSVRQVCTTPDGELEKVKQRGEVTESFQGMNQNYVIEVCAQAEKDLQEEVNKIEQIVSESEIPSTDNKDGNTTTTTLPPANSNVVINEFVSDPNTGDSEWIELYNKGNSSVDLGNWTVHDNSGTIKTLSVSIEGKGFVAFDVSNRLNNAGDVVILKNNAGAVIDQIGYGDFDGASYSEPTVAIPENGKSAGRTTDGSSTWVLFGVPTKGSSNG